MNDLKTYWELVRAKMCVMAPATTPEVIECMEGSFYAGALATLKLQSKGADKETLADEVLLTVASWPEDHR